MGSWLVPISTSVMALLASALMCVSAAGVWVSSLSLNGVSAPAAVTLYAASVYDNRVDWDQTCRVMADATVFCSKIRVVRAFSITGVLFSVTGLLLLMCLRRAERTKTPGKQEPGVCSLMSSGIDAMVPCVMFTLGGVCSLVTFVVGYAGFADFFRDRSPMFLMSFTWSYGFACAIAALPLNWVAAWLTRWYWRRANSDLNTSLLRRSSHGAFSPNSSYFEGEDILSYAEPTSSLDHMFAPDEEDRKLPSSFVDGHTLNQQQRDRAGCSFSYDLYIDAHSPAAAPGSCSPNSESSSSASPEHSSSLLASRARDCDNTSDYGFALTSVVSASHQFPLAPGHQRHYGATRDSSSPVVNTLAPFSSSSSSSSSSLSSSPAPLPSAFSPDLAHRTLE